MTWIDVADTAVKIGLGAAIAAVGAYFLAGRNHSQTLARDLAARRISILESACTDAQEFFSFCTYLYNVVGVYAESNEINERDQTDEEKKSVGLAHGKIIEALDARNRAIAKISLLGATEAREYLYQFNEALVKYRDVICHKEKMFTSQRHDEILEEFVRLREAFYSAAADCMRDTGSGRSV